MVRKVFRTGNSFVVSLPREALDALGLSEGSEISLELNPETRELVIRPAESTLAQIDETFAQHVEDFIEQYRPALKALAE